MSKTILIRNGIIINPDCTIPNQDIFVRNGMIEQISDHIDTPADKIIDAKGHWIMPGFIDMHVHLRDPGQEYKEDIESGTLAAVHGGYTAVCCMPNTSPVIDDLTILQYIKSKAQQYGHCPVYPIASITKGIKGKELTEMGLLLENGAIAFSDDGCPVEDSGRMRLAMQYARNFDALIIEHCEDKALSCEGVMHEGYFSSILGLKGIPAISESVAVSRNILIAEACGARLHICHVSTQSSIEAIRQGKSRGVRVTAETAPHYYSATDEWVAQTDYDANTKMSPPLRSSTDSEAVKQGLADGTLDVIATDHAPHHPDEKNVEFAAALNGILGLETAFSLSITNLVKPGILTPNQLIMKLSTNPARILGLPGGKLEAGVPADITIADPDADIVYYAETLHSKSRNTPFLERPYYGKILHTIVQGELKV